MSDESKVRELICPTCNGELSEGFFIQHDTKEFSSPAFHCKKCKWVWDFVPKERP